MRTILFTLIYFLFSPHHSLFAQNNTQATPPLLFDAIGFSDRSPFLKVRKDGIEQYLHPYGLQLVDEIEESSGGLFEVVVGDAYGVLDAAGNVVADFKYDEVSLQTDYDNQWYAGIPYNYKFILTKLDGRYGVVDAAGNEIAPPQYEEITIIDSLSIAFRQGGKWGWLDARNGEILQPPRYERATRSYLLPGAVEIQQDDKEGLVLRDGRVLIAPEYDYLQDFRLPGKQLVLFSKAGQAGLLDTVGKMVLPAQFENLDAIGDPNVVKFKKGDGVGLWHIKEARVVLEGFTDIDDFVVGNSIARKGQGYGVVQANGNVLLRPEYDRIVFVDAKGSHLGSNAVSIAMPAVGGSSAGKQKSAVPDFVEPYFMMVTKGGKQGVLDWSGNVVIPAEYRYIELLFKAGKPYFQVYQQERYGLFNGAGKQILPFEYAYDEYLGMNYYPQSSDYAQNQIIPLTKDNRIGLYHAGLAKIMLPVAHEYVVWNGFDQVSARRSIGEGNYKSETALYDGEGHFIRPYEEGISYVAVAADRIVETSMVDGQWRNRLVDAAGKTIYENNGWGEFSSNSVTQLLLPKDTILDAGYRNGLLKIRGEKDNLFIDKDGIEKCFSNYEFVGDFYDDNAVAMVYETPLGADETFGSARDKERLGIINSRGEVVLPVVYERMEAIYDAPELLKVMQNGKWGVVTKKGAVIMEATYDDIRFSSSSKAFVNIIKNEKQGIANRDGTLLVPPVYEQIHTDNNSFGAEVPLFMVFDGEWYQFVDEKGELLTFRTKTRLGY